jgi:pimeloyl-ACP methyl ester carboxylesterase
MQKVTSADGTTIAYDRAGTGDPLILVLGAFNDRSTHADFAATLASHFTVYNYDRRGRGASGDTAPYAVEREIEDLAAVIDDAGGSAAVFGYSSGAVLALLAAAKGLPITEVILYEPPVNENPSSMADVPERLDALVRAGRRGDAVELFQTEVIGIPVDVVAQLRNAPFRPALEAMAHTLVYETTITRWSEVPAEVAAAVTVPALVMVGGESNDWLRDAGRKVSRAVGAEFRTLPGQNHDIVPGVISPELVSFLGR